MEISRGTGRFSSPSLWALFSHGQRLLSRTAHYRSIEQLKGKIIHIVDASTISLSLSLLNGATFPTTKKGAIKIHTQLDERSELPAVVHISEGK